MGEEEEKEADTGGGLKMDKRMKELLRNAARADRVDTINRKS